MYSHTTQIRVLYGHVDKMNIVYYGRYFEYFEHARNELLRSLDLPYTSIEKAGVRLPVIETQARYFTPARYDEFLSVNTTIPELPKARIRIDYDVLNQDGTRLVTGSTVHCFLNSQNKPTRMPAMLREKLIPHFRDDE